MIKKDNSMVLAILENEYADIHFDKYLGRKVSLKKLAPVKIY